MQFFELLQYGQMPILFLVLALQWKLDRRILKIEIHLEIDEP